MLGATGFAAESAVEGYVAQRRHQIIEKLLPEAREMATQLYAVPLDAVGESVMANVGTLGLRTGSARPHSRQPAAPAAGGRRPPDRDRA